MTVTEKACSNCREIKPVSEFYRGKNSDGFISWCKPCMKWNTRRHYNKDRGAAVARSIRWAKENPDKVRRNKQRRRFAAYGISEQEFAAMVDAQGGVCAICKKSGVEFVVDHCHESGKVRGALCQKCNKGIGLLDDDPATLRSASEYLESRK